MTTETKHTPTPWYITSGRSGQWRIISEPFEQGTPIVQNIAEMHATTHAAGNEKLYNEQKDANAAFIVRACNAHDELVAFVDAIDHGIIGLVSSPASKDKFATYRMVIDFPSMEKMHEASVKYHAALAKARGEA